MKRLLAILLLTACAPAYRANNQGYHIWPERVESWDSCLDIFHCPAFAPFHRPDDPIAGTAYWLISTQGRACLVAPEVFTLANRGMTWECAWRWRRM